MNYTLTISEEERQKLAEAFAIMARKIGGCSPVLDAKSGTDQARAVLSPPPQSPVAMPPSTPASSAPPTPIEVRERWATDRAGNPWKPTSKGVKPIDVHLWKTEQKENYLRVTWQNPGQGHGNANCFDSELWPWLIKQQGNQTRLYVTQKGNYTNIVGVCA